MLTILLFISSFWAVVIWILFQKLNINISVGNPENDETLKLSVNSSRKTSKSSSESCNVKRYGNEVSASKLCDETTCSKGSVDSKLGHKNICQKRSVDPKLGNENIRRKRSVDSKHGDETTCPKRSVDPTPSTAPERNNINVSPMSHPSENSLPDIDVNLSRNTAGPLESSSKRVDRRSSSYCVTNRQNCKNVDENVIVTQDRSRPLSRKRSHKTRSVSPRGVKTNLSSADNNLPLKGQLDQCELNDWNELLEARGRPVRRETRREKLLRKRRRIISHLKEKDIDELLHVYFFCDKPQEDFQFATPQNINEKVRLPAIKIIKQLERSSSSISKRRTTRRSPTKDEGEEDYPPNDQNGVTNSNGTHLPEEKSSESVNSLPNEGDSDPHSKQYEVLKFLGHIQLSWRDADSHIPSFFDLDQPRKRSWSLVIYDRSVTKRRKRKGKKIYSKSLEEKVPTKPSIFGTVADDRSPRDNTRRGFPQTQKGSKGGYDVDGGHPLPEWAFAQDDDNSLVYEEGVLVSGSLGALVLHATPTPTYYPDAAYLFAFLLSARLFIKPHELLQKICNIGFAQQGLVNEDINTINKDELGSFVPHMVQLLGEWSETFPYDFRDERMMVGVRTLTHRCIALHPSLRRDVTQVLHNLLNKLTQLERHEESLNKLTVPPPADLLPPVPDITEACPSALILAQQLTHIELERLSYIGPEEFVQAFAKDNLESSYKDLKKTNNLESYVQWFNRLSYLVATQACSPVKKKQRIRVIEMWIEVARECFNIGNFNSLMGVIAGLNMSPVARLKKTWSKVQTAKFSVLEHQMDPSSNFSSYRSTLKAAMWRSAGAVDERQKIVIPFFSLLVKDLYFLNEGCANRLPNGHINFDKFWQLAKQVTEFMAWKQVSCPFEKDPQILHYLQTTPVLSETGLALASFEGEGPENNYEKERFKSLKAETQPPPN